MPSTSAEPISSRTCDHKIISIRHGEAESAAIGGDGDPGAMVSRPCLQAIKNFANRGGAIEIHFAVVDPTVSSTTPPFTPPSTPPRSSRNTSSERAGFKSTCPRRGTDRTERFVARQCDWQSQPIVIDQAFTRSEVTNTTQKETNGRPPFGRQRCASPAAQRLLRQTVDRSLMTRPPLARHENRHPQNRHLPHRQRGLR